MVKKWSVVDIRKAIDIAHQSDIQSVADYFLITKAAARALLKRHDPNYADLLTNVKFCREDWNTIHTLLKKGYSFRQVAQKLDRNADVIRRSYFSFAKENGIRTLWKKKINRYGVAA